MNSEIGQYGGYCNEAKKLIAIALFDKCNEEMVDWFAIQFPKIYKVFAELDIM